MKLRSILSSLLLILCSVSVCAAENADAIVARIADAFSSAPSISAYYAISSPDGSFSGEMLLSGPMFHISTPQVRTWYDGKTQWTYVAADNEVNISEPTPDELRQINPLSIISTFRTGYTAKLIKSDSSSKTLRLTAKFPDSEITSATVVVATSTMLPTRIDLSTRSGQSSSIAITRLTVGKAININAFRFPSKLYPKAVVVDIR